MADGVVVSVPNGQRPTPSPDSRPALLPGLTLGTDSVWLDSLSQTSNLWASFQVPFLPPQLRQWQKRSGLSRSPGPGPSSWPAPPRRLPQAHAVEVTDMTLSIDG